MGTDASKAMIYCTVCKVYYPREASSDHAVCSGLSPAPNKDNDDD